MNKASLSNLMGITGITTQGKRTSLKIGKSYLCHYGISTGFSCGTVTAINNRLSSQYGTQKLCNTTRSSCNSVFISISSPELKCWSGDSGGPVIEGNTAYGIVSACNTDQIPQGKQAILYLSSLDYLSELSVAVLQ